MAFSYGFFNSKNLDRVYNAENFTDYLSSLICNGIFDNYGERFKMTASGLDLTIGTGKAWIDGHYFINDTSYTLDLFKYVDFIFDGSWKMLHKVVQFTQCDETYNRVLGNDGTSCLLPTELHAGTVKMSVFGYDTQGLRATTVPITLHIRPSGFVGDDTPIPPTPDLYAQLLQKMQDMISQVEKGADGKDGLSAYNLAVQNGFNGTLAEWLLSLKGQDGSCVELRVINHELQWRPVNSEGQSLYMWTHLYNLKSLDGLSAYELAVQQGFNGTLDEWLTSLKDTDGSNADISELAEELQNLTDSTKYDIQVQNEKILHLELLIEQLQSDLESNTSVTIFSAINRIQNIGVILNEGYHLIENFIESYPNFCSAENEYALSFNQSDFGWDTAVTVIFLTEIPINSKSKIAVSYKSSSAETGQLYLIKKPESTPEIPLEVYLYNQIKDNRAYTLNFNWLKSESYITTITDCDEIESGLYYLALTGRSNNTHPLIKSIKLTKE